jgi:predicted nucleotide-binding protein
MESWDEFNDEEGVLQSFDPSECIAVLASKRGTVHFNYGGLKIVSFTRLGSPTDEDATRSLAAISNNKNIFVSHGHNEIALSRLERFLRDRLGLTPIVLAHQPDQGLTVVEKLERYAPLCCFGVVIMTQDDAVDGKSRARQNVVHEIGYLQGRLGRNRVLLLRQDDTELFSNVSGVIYVSFPSNNVEHAYDDIRKNLESLGIIERAGA